MLNHFSTQDERRTFDWLVKTRPIAQAGFGVGLGRTAPTFASKLRSKEQSKLKGFPGRNEGPGLWNGLGSYDKYGEGLEMVACIRRGELMCQFWDSGTLGCWKSGKLGRRVLAVKRETGKKGTRHFTRR